MFSTKINEPLKKRLMNSIFNQLLNVKGAVVEDARIVGSPLRPVPALEIRARPRKGMLRCPRCGRRRHGYDRGGGRRRWRHQDVFCQIFVGRFGVSFSPFERLFLGRFGFGQSCGLSVIA